MKTKYFIIFIAASLTLFGSINLADKIFAQETGEIQNVQYPVKELGNCLNKSACKTYCDKSENTEACVNFAEKNNLMSREEIGLAKKFIAAGSKGPGGCRGKDECETYCNNIEHIDECISFGEENNLIPPEELEEAKKVQAAIKRGVKPPPCGNKKTCDVYCEEPENMEVCVTFGVEAGFIQGQELEDVQKMLAAVKRGVKPPPCRGREACDEYCSSPDNMEVCMNFALEAGFMKEEEKAESQKMLAALKKGIRPPNCRGREECDAYCQQEQHFEECTNFAEAAGFMSSEEAAMTRKTGGKGPGDCKGKKECEAFCNNSENQETCFNFGKEHGLIPEEDLKMMEEGKQKFKESLNQTPPEVMDCLNSAVGSDMMEKIKSGSIMPPREIGDQMRQCFEKMGPMGPPGPGVINPAGQTMPQQAGPGGCKGPEECKTYCESHPDECKNSGTGGGEQFAPGTGPSSGPPQQNIQGGPGGMGIEGQPGENPVVPIGCEGENCLPSNPQPPAVNIVPSPPPASAPAPSPSSFNKSKLFLSSLLNSFLSLFKR